MRKTKIIATVGPSTSKPEMIEGLIRRGVNIFRLNMSHSKHDFAREIIQTIRRTSDKLNLPVGILMDTQGPAIRTGELKTQLDLKPGHKFVFTVRGEKSEELHSVDVNYDNLINDIHVNDIVLVDNGAMHFKVLSKANNKIHCEVLTEGTLGSRKHINLPGVKVSLPSITEKDKQDIKLGLEQEIDFIALSFVREAADILQLREIISSARIRPRIIAKIEDQLAVRNLAEIIHASDGIMVARGDLGIECPYEELPIIQRLTVKTCLHEGKPVIVATHMLESMIENPMPTRAEITDVANAVFEQADAIMLSGETTVGKYPLQCVEVFDRISTRIERSGGANYAENAVLPEPLHKMVKAAVVMANELRAKAIMVFTRSGFMASVCSGLRPRYSPIFAFTPAGHVKNQLALNWAVTPFQIEFDPDPELTIQRAKHVLAGRGFIEKNDHLVIVTDIRAGDRMVDAVQMRTVK